MRIERKDGKTLAFLPTWRLVIVIGMYCTAAVQLGAWIIFTIEQKPIHPVGQICLLIGSTFMVLLGYFFGRQDQRRMREAGALLEVTRMQLPVLILCMAAVPASLLVLVIISGI